MTTTITYRPFTFDDDIEQIVDLEILIWGLPERDAVPSNMLYALFSTGGHLNLALDAGRVIGFSLAMPTSDRTVVWSHMTGVHPAYQGQGVGLKLKQHQRQWATSQGYKRIRWTFDPLQAGNANFNFGLGTLSVHRYYVNYYGEMRDAINRGLPTDRLEVEWCLKGRPEVIRPEDAVHYNALLLAGRDGEPQHNGEISFDQQAYQLHIPPHIGAIKNDNPQRALAWRLALRHAMQQTLAAGYQIDSFMRTADGCFYIARRPAPWYLYVLECTDSTLYTGITNDIERRIKRHQAGKGAAYTATRRPVRLLARWQFAGRTDAASAEIHFKRQSRADKLALIASASDYRSGIFCAN